MWKNCAITRTCHEPEEHTKGTLLVHFTSGIFPRTMESTHAQLQAWKAALLKPLNVALQVVAEAMAQAAFNCDVEK